MFGILRRILLLIILTCLKIAIILANSTHFTFVCICNVVADNLQLPAPYVWNDSSSTMDSSTQHCSNSIVSTSVQTEERLKFENVADKSSTDVIIHNLNSTQRLVITPSQFKRSQCVSCQSAAEIVTSVKTENLTTVGIDGSNISYMSIENDVIDSKIENGCSNFLTNSDENKSLNRVSGEFNTHVIYVEPDIKTSRAENNGYKRVSFDNTDNACSSFCNGKFNETFDFKDLESLKENDPDNTYVKYIDTTTNKQKTSSPLNKPFQSSSNVCTNLSWSLNPSQIFENKEVGTSTSPNYMQNDDIGSNFKRRLSLPIKLNRKSAAFINFKLAQKKLIEDAINTSRGEKSVREIKYPFPSEISLDSKHNEEMDDKAAYSSSSYESLPVSDHLRNAVNNSTLLSLYNENHHSEDKPDFSCIDNLVDAFNEIKANISVPNVAQSKIISSTTSRNDATRGFESLNVEGFLAQGSSDDLIKESPKLPDDPRKESPKLLDDPRKESPKLLDDPRKESPKLSDDPRKETPKLSDDLKDTKFVNDEKDKTVICSGISLNTSVTDMCNVLNKFVAGEIKLFPSKVLKIDESRLKNDKDINSDNSRSNELSKINDSERSHSSTKEYESHNSPVLKEENHNSIENERYQIQFTFLSPLKTALSDKCEWIYDVENTLLCQKDNSEANKSESSDNMPNILQQSYHKIAFIDDSPTHERSQTNQNTSETNDQSHFLDENKKPTLFEANTLRDLKVETNKSFKCDNLFLPIQQRCNDSFEESTDEPNKITFMSSPNQNIMSADLFEWTGKDENTVLSLKDKEEINKTSNNERFYQQRYTASINEISLRETSDTYQTILETNCEERQSALCEENPFSADSVYDSSKVTMKDFYASNE